MSYLTPAVTGVAGQGVAPPAVSSGLGVGPQLGALPPGVQSAQDARQLYSGLAAQQSIDVYGYNPQGKPAGLAESERSHLAAINEQNRYHQRESWSDQRDHEAARLARLFPGVTPWELLGNTGTQTGGAPPASSSGHSQPNAGQAASAAVALAAQRTQFDLQREELKTRTEVARLQANAQIKTAEIASGAPHRMADYAGARLPLDMDLTDAQAEEKRVLSQQKHPAEAMLAAERASMVSDQRELTRAQTEQYLASARNLGVQITHEQIKMGLTNANIEKTQAEALLAKLGVPEASHRALLAEAFVQADLSVKQLLDLEHGSRAFGNVVSGIATVAGMIAAGALARLPYGRALSLANRLKKLVSKIPGLGPALEKFTGGRKKTGNHVFTPPSGAELN